MTVLAATRLEERAVRRALGDAKIRVVRSGVGRGGCFNDAVISCGLAGGLRSGVPPGTVVIAGEIVRPNGDRVACDSELVTKLNEAARALGVKALTAPIVTAATLVRNAARAAWAEQGFAAADMESGLIFAPKLAAVRVILDTPERELSEGWTRPFSFFFSPHMWRELPWLASAAPSYARAAAEIVARSLEMPPRNVVPRIP